MQIDDIYLKITKDLSGTVQKNRTRQEYLWSLKKIFELYLDGSDFKIIFDYACDIDLITDKFAFYQLKTDKNSKYTIESLIKIPPKSKESILSTLCRLYSVDVPTELFIVSNQELSVKNLKNNLETPVKCLSFDNLSDDDQNKIINHLVNECSFDKSKVVLSKIHFISSDINLNDFDTFCIGETTKFLNALYSNENGAMSLKNLLVNLILERAGFEYFSESLDEVVKYKGISKEEFHQILNDLCVTNKNNDWLIFEKVKTELPVLDSYRLGKALKNIKENGFSNGMLNEYIEHNKKCLESELSSLKMTDFLIESAKRKTDSLSFVDKLAYCIIAYAKMED